MWEEPPPMVILWSMNDLSRLALGRSENEAKEQGKVDISQSRTLTWLFHHLKDMEESINSSVSSLPCSSEVSGWTMYLEDFMAAEDKSQIVSCSSIISDAAPASSTVVDVSGESRKLRLKREKEDDSLQDTASSSFNSPSPKVAENDHSLEGGIPKVIAGYLLEEEISELSEIFKSMDSDNSGSITLEELRKGLADQGSKLSERELTLLMEGVSCTK